MQTALAGDLDSVLALLCLDFVFRRWLGEAVSLAGKNNRLMGFAAVVAGGSMLLGLAGCSSAVNSADPVLENERVVVWDAYEVTGENKVEVIAFMGSEECYGHRTVAEEHDGVLRVAIVEGGLSTAPDDCSGDGKEMKFEFDTKSPAVSMQIEPLDSTKIDLAN